VHLRQCVHPEHFVFYWPVVPHSFAIVLLPNLHLEMLLRLLWPAGEGFLPPAGPPREDAAAWILHERHRFAGTDTACPTQSGASAFRVPGGPQYAADGRVL
jgi:hypothetical protein